MSAVQYQELLAFRTALRRFLRWSEQQAAAAGVTGQQHQLLLAIRGHDGPGAPTVGDVAEHLLLRHHSAAAGTLGLNCRGRRRAGPGGGWRRSCPR